MINNGSIYMSYNSTSMYDWLWGSGILKGPFNRARLNGGLVQSGPRSRTTAQGSLTRTTTSYYIPVLVVMSKPIATLYISAGPAQAQGRAVMVMLIIINNVHSIGPVLTGPSERASVNKV